MFSGQESTFQLVVPEAILQPSLSQFIGLPVDVVLSLLPPSSSEQDDDIIFRCSAERVVSNGSDFNQQSEKFCVDFLRNVGKKNCLLIVVCQCVCLPVSLSVCLSGVPRDPV